MIRADEDQLGPTRRGHARAPGTPRDAAPQSPQLGSTPCGCSDLNRRATRDPARTSPACPGFSWSSVPRPSTNTTFPPDTQTVSILEHRPTPIRARKPSMPSNARRRSSNSLVVKSNNESAVASAVRAWAAQVVSRHTEVTRIIWFGSRVHGHPVPSSDVDVCIVLSHSNEPVRDRASK